MWKSKVAEELFEKNVKAWFLYLINIHFLELTGLKRVYFSLPLASSNFTMIK